MKLWSKKKKTIFIKNDSRSKIFLLKYIVLVTLGVIITSVGFTLFFIYNNISESLQSAGDILILRTEVIPEIYNINEFQKIIEHAQQKQKPEDKTNWALLHNAFNRDFQQPQINNDKDDPINNQNVPLKLPSPF